MQDIFVYYLNPYLVDHLKQIKQLDQNLTERYRGKNVQCK